MFRLCNHIMDRTVQTWGGSGMKRSALQSVSSGQYLIQLISNSV